jgi:3-dehydroquinate synthase
MEDLRMSSGFIVKSKVIGEYKVLFIEELRTHLKSTTSANALFIIDRQVFNLFESEMKEILDSARYILIDCDEKHKTVDYSQEVIRELIKQNVRKDDTLVAIGGGITQDIVAFISSILYRGVKWKFYPTTLLAQCDSCIGSKSSINFDQFKNLLGTFNPPVEIFIYPGFLETLSNSEIRSGIGEMLHYFFTEGIEIAQQVSDNFDSLLTDRALLPFFINNSLRIKKKVIEIDEFDESIRHIFNYGHTFGHAIEAITDYSIPHGQAISIGMDLANFISLELGMMKKEDFEVMNRILVNNIPEFRITSQNIDLYCAALARDKKNKDNKLGCILSRGPGKVEKTFLTIDESLRHLILKYFSRKF